MRLTALGHYLPTRVVGLDETLDLFRHYSRHLHDDRSLAEVIAIAKKSLEGMGFRTIRVRAPGEKFYANYLDMTKALIEKSGVPMKDIDTVIYVGVGRGYREPSTAYQMASRLGLRNAECYDLLDACTGWTHALKVQEPQFLTGRSRHALILSLEFNRSTEMNCAVATEGGRGMYELPSVPDLEWAAWGATVGEAGIASLVSKDDSNGWYFDFEFDADMHRQCGFTLANYHDYDLEPNIIEAQLKGDQRFYAYGRAIGLTVKDHLHEVWKHDHVQQFAKECKVVMGHSISLTMYKRFFDAMGIGEKARYSFPDYGNTVSCGVPLTLSKAIEAGDLQHNDRVLLTPCGSGAAYGVVSFLY